jgi:hypothetical protein
MFIAFLRLVFRSHQDFSAPHDRRLLSSGDGGWFARRCYDARRAAADYLAIGIRDHPIEVGILQSLILGYRERLTDEMATLFALRLPRVYR